MKSYTVDIDKSNSFSVESCLLTVNGQEVRIVNLRSVKGHIGIDFDFLSD